MDLSQYAELFLAESREHVSACNQLLLEWERTPASAEPVGGIFRSVHTVKGMAATMGYARVADLAHRMENLLDRLRKTKGAAGGDLLQLLFRATDLLERAIGLAVQGREKDVDVAALGAELDAAAKRAGAPAGRVGRPGRTRVSASMPQAAAVEDGAARGRLVTIALRAEAPLKGGRALLVLRRAQSLGLVSHISPPEQAFGAEDFDGHFTLRLDTPTPAAEVERALAGAGDVESVSVAEPEAGASARAAEGAAAIVGAAAERSRHIRVDLRRLDALMDLIGELVTARGRLNQIAADRRDPVVDDVAIQVSRLTGELQAEIIQARMTPVWQVFDRYPRLVRDLARQLDKQVALRVEGKEIELDRTILDELGDPLVHLLRNAVDHGIETPAERKRRGKPAEGEIILGAVRERASVAISITDDGRGLDRRRILEKAKKEGFVDAGVETLTDDQLLRVIARPGFSTTEAVTSVSGRGVGLDVAMSKIRALGGTIEVQSEPGRGTTFVLRLPVTLAIVRALIADVGGERYALPLTYVSETVEFGAVPSTTVEGREAMVLRNRVVPLVHLRELLSAGGGTPSSARRPVVVLQMGERRAGVVVDAMLGQQEIVVKSFDAPQGTLPVFSGATIMGDGVPALILDAGGLV
jgi:two-component system, chemotaxis family, sensor kinase CheA